MGFPPLLKDYFELQTKYERKYGPKTVLFYEVGSFYEIYETDCPIHIGKAKEISDVLSIQVTKKNKSKTHNESNPYMVGFPSPSVNKYIKKLINMHYTIVKYDQKNIQDSDRKERTLDKIYSASTYIDSEMPSTNNLVAIIKENDTQYTLSSVDLTTGYCQVYEAYSTKEVVNKAENEAFRFVHSLNPTELLVYDKNNGQDIIKDLQLDSDIVHYRKLDKEFTNINYQNQFLEKVYHKLDISPIEYLNLDHYPDSVICFIFLLQFAHEHDPSIITRIQKPKIYLSEHNLILNRDTFTQLNIISDNNRKTSSVFNLINHCYTNMGRRLLKERLLNPIVDINELESRYNCVGQLIEINKQNLIEILEQICDLPKKHRKAMLGKLTPKELSGLVTSYDLILQLMRLDLPVKIKKSTKNNFIKLLEKLENTFIINKLDGLVKLNDIKFSIFPKGRFPNIDKLDADILNLYRQMEHECKKYNDMIDPNKSCVKIISESDGHYLETTPTRFKNLSECEEVFRTAHKNKAKFYTTTFRQASLKCCRKEKEMIELVMEMYKKKIMQIYKIFSNTLENVSIFVSQIDVYCSSAIVAEKYNYKRPKLVKKDCSSVSVKKCRHPLIERIIDCEYVSNSFTLDSSGILLYGINSSGKSSLLKSVGCNIVLAQAGMFVPCREMVLSPYKTIYSKILSDDNLFKGQSTFVKEMAHLRDILQGADKYSLVLADELCSGTESLSATAILASTLSLLEKRDSCYVFSTHLHDLPQLDLIKNMKKLQIYHFNVTVENGKVIYNRSLSTGSGDSTYGLEIAKAMNIDSEFIRNAFTIRETLCDRSIQILNTKKSKYNAKKFVHACEKCGKQGEGLHTHHIQEQKLADCKGMIGDMHKNVLSNLMVLCEECHRKIHL